MKVIRLMAAALLTGLTCQTASAITDTVTIEVSGTLTRPPCVVTGSKTLSVNFGTRRYDQVAAAPLVSVPINLTCPPNSSLNVSVKASGAVAGSTTQATTGKENLAYSLTWNSDSSDVNITGVKKTLTKLSGAVDLGMKAKLIANGTLTEGAFSASTVVSIEYL
ncbi:Peptide synthetase [Pseudomonas orientalis]|uniref:fimbrial protein n=1 Tax=Pseudomonas orientalis TaxID=76758 RepID=UPI000F568736|nr:spore coat protein U domain-containing protein [Pseudomonas orientalis]AZE95467.1 Peptide synthetase [Pseudomonas orientalis]